MDIRASHELKRNILLIQAGLQLGDSLPNRRPGIMIEAGQNVRGAGDYGYALRELCLRHRKRHGQIASPVIKARQNMAVKVDH